MAVPGSVTRALAVSAIVLASGCASGGGGGSGSSSPEMERTVQLTIRNESANPITVFAWWQSGRRVRLGNVLGVATNTFTTPLRAGGIWFEVEDATRMNSGGRGRRPDGYLPIGPDDHLEVITGLGGAILSVRALP